MRSRSKRHKFGQTTLTNRIGFLRCPWHLPDSAINDLENLQSRQRWGLREIKLKARDYEWIHSIRTVKAIAYFDGFLYLWIACYLSTLDS